MFEIPFVVSWLSSLDPEEEAATVQPIQTRHGEQQTRSSRTVVTPMRLDILFVIQLIMLMMS